ncbi:MAG: hypothetical protein JSW65_05360 [Candidatus Bipolaricaulota bacterium]|nr:MAG: hypothetical protein JSW65_05360 [Candidatus Bipolaricaulota bacterium]
MMRRAVVGVALAAVCLGVTGVAQGLDFFTYDAGPHILGVFTNLTGDVVTGLQVEFALGVEVTIVEKLEVGGFLMALSPATGREFTYAGGGLVHWGQVYLEWDDPTALPIFAQWLSGTEPVGAPYVILEAWIPTLSIEEFGTLLANGIVAAREANPAALMGAFDAFFAANADYFAGLEETLGMPLAASLMPVIESAPAEGIVNFFVTLTNMLGVTSVPELLQGEVDFGALLQLLGM